MSTTVRLGTALIAAAVLFFAVNIIADGVFRTARLDLTENRLYTLSAGTEATIAGLAEPVTLRFFYSQKLANAAPQLRLYGERVRDLLETYASRSKGKITLVVIDPEPFSDAEDRAVGYGLQGAPLGAGGDLFYFGLVGTNTTDDSAVAPFFSPENEEFLEYELTKLIYTLSNPTKPVVGVITSLPLEFGPGGMQAAMQGQSRPYAVLGAMRQFFEVRMLAREQTRIDAEVDILMIAHPKDLSETTLYAVDQFILKGGRALIFLDPYSETAAAIPPAPGQPPNPLADQSSTLAPLLAAWGVEFDTGTVVADRALATRVNAGGRATRQVIDYPAWLSARGDVLDQGDVVTGELGTLLLASAGRIALGDGAKVALAPLVTSSPDSMLIPADKIKGGADPEAVLREFAPEGERYVIAARLTGAAPSAFDGPPATEAAEDDAGAAAESEAADEGEEPAPHLAQSTGPINVIVVADTDMLDDRFWLQRQRLLGQELVIPTASNGDLVVNALDNLAGSNELISLRSRGRSERPFEVIEELRVAAEQQYLAREKALEDKLAETEQKLADLQSKSEGGGALLSAEQAAAIETFRQDIVDTRQELRAVQRNLRKDVEALESRLKFLNIGAVPLLVFVAAIVLAVMRYQRRKASAALKEA